MSYIDIANKFKVDSQIIAVKQYGNGNVNDTYLATSKSGKKYILQRINEEVFKSPRNVMDNMCIVTTHVSNHIKEKNLNWKIQNVIKTNNNYHHHISKDGNFWRMISFISESCSFDIIDTNERAYELGRALGVFHTLMEDLPKERLSYVIVGFHITTSYLDLYKSALAKTTIVCGENEKYICSFIDKNKKFVNRLEEAKREKILPRRIIHGDPKINNIMFDIQSGNAVSMIDLDTVQPGLIHYDIGDCARSSCNPLGEEAKDRWKDTTFDIESFEYLWNGYLEQAKIFLKKDEYYYIYDCIFVIAFELGLRFFTDYLNGDVYFKIRYPKNNLYRALVQFRLAQSIQENRKEIENIVFKSIREKK